MRRSTHRASPATSRTATGTRSKPVANGDSRSEAADANVVTLTGRLAASPETLELPSGDLVMTLRLVVARPKRRPASGRSRTASVDTIDCTVWSAAVRRRIERWEPGDIVTVEGALRRRFWQSAGGARSRYDVEVSNARRERSA